MITALLILLLIGLVSIGLVIGNRHFVAKWTFNISFKVLTRLVKRNKWDKDFASSKLTEKIPSDTDFGYTKPTPEAVALNMLFKRSKSVLTSLQRFKSAFSMMPIAFTDEPKDMFRAQTLSSPDCIPYLEVVHEHVPEESDHIVVHFHGGGHCMGAPSDYLQVLVELSKRTGMKVVSADYDLVPDVSLAEQVNQCVELVQHFAAAGKSLYLIGDSAGGGLVVASMQKIISSTKRNQRRLPVCAVVLSPYLSKSGSNESRDVNAELDCIVTPALLEGSEALILQNVRDPAQLNFQSKSCRGFPPMMVFASETEALYSDSVELYNTCRNDGVDITFESAPYGLHIYPLMFKYAPEYEQSFARACKFITDHAESN